MKKLFTSLKYVMTVAALALSTHVMAGTIDWVASEQGYANAEAVESIDFGGGITATLSKGSNSNGPKYYNTGTAIRLYGGNSMTITAEGVTITEIALTFGSGDGTNGITVDTGDFASGTWQGSASSVTFTIDGTTGHRRIASITITYTSEGGGGVTVKRPVISPASGTYTEPQTVTITAESGLTIYYSPQVGTTFQQYTGPFTVSADAIVTAYAQDAAGNKSSEVTATYTIVNLSDLTGSGTASDPYTVGDAMALYAASALPADKVFVKGKISRIKSLDVASYSRAQYYISDDGTTTSDELYIYNGYYLNGEAFTDNDQIKVGDDVVVYGKLVLFGSTKEMDANNYIYSLNGEGGGGIEVKTYETLAAAKAGAKDTAAEAILKLNDVVVTFVDGTNYYISDGNDGFLIYGSIGGLTDIAAGDVLKGQIKGDLYTYHGLPELVPATTGTEVMKNGTAEVVPEDVEMGDVLADGLAYSSKLVKLSEVMFGASELAIEGTNKHGQVTIMSMGEEALLFDQFDVAKGLVFDTDAEDYEFSAIVCLRDGVVQFYPTNKAELERDTPTPEYPTYTDIHTMQDAATADKVVSIFRESNLLVTYVNGKSIYIQDNDDDRPFGFLLFADAAVKDVKAGDRITVDIKGELYLYHGLPELAYKAADATITVESEGNEVTPNEDNLMWINNDGFGWSSLLVTFWHPIKFTAATLTSKAVTFTGVVDGETYEGTLYDQFGVLTGIEFDTEKEYVGLSFIVSIRDEVVQYYPINRSEFITEEYVFDGDGTQENPYSVADVIYLQLNSQAPAEKVWVKGTIIGTVNGSFKEEKFANTTGDENLVTSNIVLADADTHSAGPRKAPAFDAGKCIPVELKNGSVFREKLNLVDNFGNLGKEVLVNGNVTAYFSAPGVKNLDDAIIDGVSLGVHGVEMDKEVLGGTIYTLSGQKVNTITRHGLYIIGGKKVLMK
ncbi:MAG: chitobiase/beta-hexosaminidase C-terminal domain-containing protein [Bacteroidaceae bacterium]|nr:chitobiase/beta-hexosaminidase C-terminal domain-containing protein [Bacteroidaceae bacterium]